MYDILLFKKSQEYSRTSGYDHLELSYATTSRQRPVFQNTKRFQVKSPYLEPLVSDHLS